MQITDFDLNAIQPGFIENPYPTLHALRKADPLHENPDGSVYLTRYDDCLRVYQSRSMLSDKTQAFTQKFGNCPLLEHHSTSLVFNDPPYHTVVRKLISSAFTPRKLAEFEPLIERIVDKLLDQAADQKHFDLIDNFAKILPTEIISFMLGIPEVYRARLRDYSIAILGALDPIVPDDRMKAGNDAVQEFAHVLDDVIQHRRKNPDTAQQGEVLQSLIFGVHDGRQLTQVELIQNCIFLLNAGHETTTSMIGNAIGLLLDHPDQLARLQRDPNLIATTLEETLRMESPLQIGNRLAGEDITFRDRLVHKGTYIHTSIAGANRDPTVFEAPDTFDISRKPNRHIAFISGIHVCLGATLARMEGRIAIGRLIARFPKLEDAGLRVRLPLARFRGYSSFPIRV
ncbi:MAG: cytochrome P450 [Paracoccaceae bacterium]